MNHLFDEVKVLDHGFIKVIDVMGDDNAIAEAARVSYGDGTKKSRDNAGLIRYLMRHGHTSPFEMCEIKLCIKMPMFVARQWIRHRTASVNEYSGRYSEIPDEFYVPSIHRIKGQSKDNKQGTDFTHNISSAQMIQDLIEKDQTVCYANYKWFLQEGAARELARVNLPVSAYTVMYWKIDLHNLLKFLKLRCDSHAQFEIQEYANAILKKVEEWVPVAYSAFMDYVFGSVTLSKLDQDVLKYLFDCLHGGDCTIEHIRGDLQMFIGQCKKLDGVSKGEITETVSKLIKLLGN